VLGITLCELLWIQFQFNKEVEAYLSERFQEAVEFLGQFVAGTEKLFRWTGESQMLKLCSQKNDEIGMDYELVRELENRLEFLIYVKSHVSNCIGEISPVFSSNEDWGRIVREKGREDATILVADSFYLDLTDRTILQELDVLYLCAVQFYHFATLYRQANIIFHHAGTTTLLYSDKLHEMFVTH
jgi:hypothetical protein